ncbi:RuvX/YqgF family protein [Patescibacteria group bacterium]|nr:RuvX/YqgF family protein [Patescibacteria group bacterium]MCG2693557.1 RuvX/YqgF family protein [Candidatus Parcubacteria bacterium]
MSKILGIDWGQSKIGLAVGSTEVGVASPFDIIKNDIKTIDIIKNICCDKDIKTIVAGELRDENKKFDKFIDGLKFLGLTVELEDERMTSKMAGNLNRDLRGQDDAAAASLVLQGWLERKSVIDIR